MKTSFKLLLCMLQVEESSIFSVSFFAVKASMNHVEHYQSEIRWSVLNALQSEDFVFLFNLLKTDT